LRSVFFGTPEFAVPSLEAMVAAGIDVALVVTQPDRPVGRHSTPVPSPVAKAASEKGMWVEKPERVRSNAALFEEIRKTSPDVGVVVAYGKILPGELLEIPRLGFVNVHASLLPKFRGASPVAAAILAGEEETGVATMRVVEELDAGPVYLVRRTAIDPDEDAGTLSRRLSEMGAPLLVETLRGLEAGSARAVPQSGEPSFCRTIRREDGEIDWTLDAGSLSRRLRAYTPWPGLFTFLGGERIKILDAVPGPAQRPGEPGALWSEDGKLYASAGGGSALEVRSLQRAGRNAVSGAEFARSLKTPARFGRFGRSPA
jgi:methionyl-tRNA formyltransferase